MEGQERTIASFEDLECWKRCRTMRKFVAECVVPQLPESERFRLSDQLLRSARSTTANIAEGYGRFHYLDNAKFCTQARGSCYEVLDHLITAVDEGLLSEEILVSGRRYLLEAIRVLNGYIRYLKTTSQSSSPKRYPGSSASPE